MVGMHGVLVGALVGVDLYLQVWRYIDLDTPMYLLYLYSTYRYSVVVDLYCSSIFGMNIPLSTTLCIAASSHRHIVTSPPQPQPPQKDSETKDRKEKPAPKLPLLEIPLPLPLPLP